MLAITSKIQLAVALGVAPQTHTAIPLKSAHPLFRDRPPQPQNDPGLSPVKFLTKSTRFFFSLFTRPPPKGPLTQKEATDNVYLDTQVMGSNPGENVDPIGNVQNPQIRY